MASAICFKLLWQTVRRHRSRTVAKTGSKIAAITATMPTTTSSSISVKPRRVFALSLNSDLLIA